MNWIHKNVEVYSGWRYLSLSADMKNITKTIKEKEMFKHDCNNKMV